MSVATGAAAPISDWLKKRPVSVERARTVGHCGVVPTMLVVQFWFAYWTWPDWRIR